MMGAKTKIENKLFGLVPLGCHPYKEDKEAKKKKIVHDLNSLWHLPKRQKAGQF